MYGAACVRPLDPVSEAPGEDLPIGGALSKAPPSDPEAVWLRDVYRPDEPNLTLRGAIVGVLIGGVMSLSNIYVFFKTGWSLGVTLTACILGFAVFKLLELVGQRPLGALENNAMTTVASGAGYMTAGGNAAAFGALMMVTATLPPAAGLIAWFAIISALGVFVAIPIKRQLINREGLVFPTGVATAQTIRTIHTSTDGKGAAQALALAVSGLVAGGLTVLRDFWKVIPGAWAPAITLKGHALIKWGIALKTELVLVGAGALMSFRTGWSLLVGAAFNYLLLAPWLLDHHMLKLGANQSVSYAAIVNWTLWPGAAILVGAGLTSFALDWRSIVRTFSGLGAVFDRSKRDATGIEAVEAPAWWFAAGLLLLTPAIVTLMYLMFGIPVWAGIFAVPLAVVLGFVAARVTGETDVTPTKALGPVTQVIYGALSPGNMVGNIMSANVTGGIGLHAADLLTTLKTGWLLGAKPRHQVYAQLIGVLAGAAIIVPLFYIVVPIDKLGSEAWPAPSAMVWKSVSEAFVHGVGSLSSTQQWSIFVGATFGIAMTLREKYMPKSKHVLPSPSAIGIAMMVPASNSIAMFLGSLIAMLVAKRWKKYEAFVIPIASGVIAGESVVGVIHTIWETVL
ncbi:OPT family oligopeptide transporter [soil metagenome]